jgi:hypothetical protein
VWKRGVTGCQLGNHHPRCELLFKILADNPNALAERIQQDQYDIFLFAEHGLNPVHVLIGHQWNDRMNAHLEGKTFNVLGFNRQELDEASWHQVGGCGITVSEEYASMKVEHGVDDTGLGRYCWVVLQGRMNTRVRIVSAYRPVENKLINFIRDCQGISVDRTGNER